VRRSERFLKRDDETSKSAGTEIWRLMCSVVKRREGKGREGKGKEVK